jgi:hypothetical protein
VSRSRYIHVYRRCIYIRTVYITFRADKKAER